MDERTEVRARALADPLRERVGHTLDSARLYRLALESALEDLRAGFYFEAER